MHIELNHWRSGDPPRPVVYALTTSASSALPYWSHRASVALKRVRRAAWRRRRAGGRSTASSKPAAYGTHRRSCESAACCEAESVAMGKAHTKRRLREEREGIFFKKKKN